jgi:hypothetical protein
VSVGSPCSDRGGSTRVRYPGPAPKRHTGELMGIAPTGKQFTVTATGIFRCANGLDAEHTVNFDALGLMQQLGAIPAQEPVTA